MHPSHQRLGVEVFIPGEGNKSNPSCPHGPMLMFERYFESKPPRRFYSCSACRDRKECNFFLWENETLSTASQEAHKQIIETSKPSMSYTQYWERLEVVKTLKESQRTYCHTCEHLVLPKERDKHISHDMTSGISDNILASPSYLFKPLDKKKSFAQYLFSNSAVEFLLETFEKHGYTKILCIGTPRVHEAIQAKKVKDVDSILLDMDHRYAQFNEEARFIHYNMFNHYFFDEDLAKPHLQNFFKKSTRKSLLVVVDPPFGGLVEVLAASLKKIWTLGDWDKKKNEPFELATFWIFPYFMETRIVNEMPSFKMCEFKVDYDNHPLYKKHRSGSKSSPVRIFTNVPLRDIVLPRGYRYCEKCERYVCESNVHCELCNDCTSKDGRVWLHCTLCNKCVKKGRVHCQSCHRCEPEDHVCQRSLRGCHICGNLEHKRKDCPDRIHLGGNKRKKKKDKSSKRKKQKGVTETELL